MANEYDEAVKDAEMILREYEQGDDVSWVEPQHVRRLSRAVLAMAKRLEVPTGEDAAWVARAGLEDWRKSGEAARVVLRRLLDHIEKLEAERRDMIAFAKGLGEKTWGHLLAQDYEAGKHVGAAGKETGK